ncbi:inactive protein RESTRICTED TEV MOVEMENT 2-like [Herrania umbratica]|uniref:Inactive protein RESTRICTED TEV MOVEMENT 2-like n=1 Tax=Herrania umbratica TaxID=108875 RepID=A0A6J1AK88_9ROSI|nr:inactive protein RESTRICTED TEV MOVEMENT 2-like [Herrania umbratica]
MAFKDRSRRWPSHIADKFVPPSFWTEDAKGSYLLDIDLPGFKHEEVRIELPSAGHIKIEGERIVNENKCIYIDQTFPLPENSDLDNIVGKFEGERLYITVPKILAAEQDEDEDSRENDENTNSTAEEANSNDENQRKHEQSHGAIHPHDSNKKGKRNEACRVASFPKEIVKKWNKEDNPLQMAIKCLKRNKGVVLSIVISFSLGVWVSQLFIKNGEI